MDALFADKKKGEKFNFEEQKGKILKKLERLQNFTEIVIKYGEILEQENKKPGNWQDKNVTPLHTILMCLRAIGENATELIQFRKNKETYDQNLRDTLNKYNSALSHLSGISTSLIHEIGKLPNFKKTIGLYKFILTEFKKLELLPLEISHLAQSYTMEQPSLVASVSDIQTKGVTAEKSLSMV